jgi:hypothetical protein
MTARPYIDRIYHTYWYLWHAYESDQGQMTKDELRTTKCGLL